MRCTAGACRLRGSLIVAAQTVWSSGVGASVGLEAGYTQFASGIASPASAMRFWLRRGDLRILVGCGCRRASPAPSARRLPAPFMASS